ncbi:MAG: hypothetical protein JWQ81_3 [Amycolatopsis sp.]|jgi:hypothetical protein|uniref:trypsin-like peptidase domain-containing protein n=1 Tax=Amycolatopsis sp. TaxID=37632 RepID=UPI0026047323|nr:trypsin-like peptidase domain-containing protein [Amycolatopsis sp.]MCU1679264.1 hypothetical protein [Amycolatopsis sp.]
MTNDRRAGRLESHVHRLARVHGTRHGSGYAVTATLVLTAGHVVGEVGSECLVRPESGGEYPALVRWRGDQIDLDAALVEVLVGDGEPWRAVPELGWAELRGAGHGECLALGYPWVNRDDEERRVAELVCRASPTSGRTARRYELHLVGAPPRDRPRDSGGKSPSTWAGLSGGPLLTKDGKHILGVVHADNRKYGNSSLNAVRVGLLLADDKFARLVRVKPDDVHAEWTAAKPRTVGRGVVAVVLGAVVALSVGVTVAITTLGGGAGPETAPPGAPPLKVQGVTAFKASSQDGRLVLPDAVTMSAAEASSLGEATSEGGSNFDKWYAAHGGGTALDSGFTNITVQNTRSDPVRITDMKVLKDCTAPLNGTALQRYTQGGGGETVKVGFDLDAPDPLPQQMAMTSSGLMGMGVNYFAAETVTLTPGQAQTITVGAFTATRHCRFTFRMVVATSDGSFTQDVDAGSKPFEVSATARPASPAHPYSGYRKAYVQNDKLDWVSVDPSSYEQK